MAIVFVSPKRRQRILQLIFASVLAVVVLLVAGVTFWPEIKSLFSIEQDQEIAAMPNVKINFSVVDSEKVKNLEAFPNLSAADVTGRQNPFAIYEQVKTQPKK